MVWIVIVVAWMVGVEYRLWAMMRYINNLNTAVTLLHQAVDLVAHGRRLSG